jgi:hypothetical protein
MVQLFVALQILTFEILRSVDGGIAPHHRSPIAAMKPVGQDLRGALAPGTGDSTALLALECQSFLGNVIAQFRGG